MAKKKIKKRYIFLILLLAILIFFWIACFSPLFPIALNDGLDEVDNLKIVDYDINRSVMLGKKIHNTMAAARDKTEFVDNKYYSRFDLDESLKYLKKSVNGAELKDGITYYFCMYDPRIMMCEYDVEKTLNYNINKINNENLKDYNIFNALYEDYYKEKSYYNWDRFTKKTKIIKKENSTFVIFPVEYYGFSIGPDEAGFPRFFFRKYGQNILICQDDTIIQVQALADNKEDLIQKNIEFANTLLTEFHKASIDKNYEIEAIGIRYD